MSEFEQVRDGVGGGAVESSAVASSVAESPVAESPVAAAMGELETLDRRDLAEHPDVYQRIHAELQSALATIDNA